jgi:hypothetical protein
MLDAEAIKAKLADVPGIEQLAFTLVGDRLVAAFNGRTTSTAHNASEDQMILAIRNAASLPPVPDAPVVLNPQPLPTSDAIAAPAAPKVKTMANPAPGGFAAQIKAMLDGARADLANVKAEGLAQVQSAVQEHVQAGQQVKAVAANMAQMIRSETADALAELGQISNMPPVDEQ